MPIIFGKGGTYKAKKAALPSAEEIIMQEPSDPEIIDVDPASISQAETPSQVEAPSQAGEPLVPSQLDPTPPLDHVPVSKAEFFNLANGFMFMARIMQRHGLLSGTDMKDLETMTALFGFGEQPTDEMPDDIPRT